MKKQCAFAWAVLVLALVLVLAGCGGGDRATVVPTQVSTSGETGGSQPAAPSTESVQATAESAAEPGTGPTEPAMPEEADEANLDLDSVSTGLAKLKSYKSRLDMHFSGTDAEGQAVDSSWTVEEAFVLDPRAQQIVWTGSESKGGEAPTVTKWTTINVGGTSYMISVDAEGTESCVSYSAEDQTPPESSLTPDMWGSIEDARYIGRETVNGVKAKHYTWKEGALALWGFAEGKADTWVAIDGGYVVKQSIEAKGKGLFLAESDQEGTTTWEWNVTEANGSFSIEPPAGCESAAAGLPIMADATEQTAFGDMTSYSTVSAFADVVSFYKAEMPKAGWEASGTPTEMEGFASLEFAKEGSTASVMISYDASAAKTTVIISIAKQ